jgi:hypothetical protein
MTPDTLRGTSGATEADLSRSNVGKAVQAPATDGELLCCPADAASVTDDFDILRR